MQIGMRSTDLGELYALLVMYGQVYGGIDEGLLLEVAENYEKTMEWGGCGNNRKKDIPMSISNPRGAGRKPRKIEGEVDKIVELRRNGMTIRAIASQVGCSNGYVHKLIHEHN